MLRSFLPVGQGAFYKETFNLNAQQYTIIYDCGSSTDKSIVERQIETNFHKDEKISAVFISHLDDDHINGLPFLLKYCTVENLFFPLITTKDRVYLKLNAFLTSDKEHFLYNFIENPHEAFRSIGVRAPRLYQIAPNEQDVDYNNNIDAQRIYSGENVINIINTDKACDTKWELIPFNFKQTERVDMLKKAIIDIFGCNQADVEKQIEELIDNYPQNSEKIKQAYREVSGSFNANSLTLFSGIRDHKYVQTLNRNKNYYYEIKNGCLYMGDYDASKKSYWDELKNAYYRYWDYIGCIQIPHHGSRHNYNSEISKMGELFIISAGYTNKYHHPHSAVIKDLLLNNRNAFVVTEDFRSQLDLNVFQQCF